MDNKKIVAVSVLAVLALAFAGYGYADYTASTYNSDNYITTEFITLKPVSFDAMAGEDLDKIDMNTWTFYQDNEIQTIWKLDDAAGATEADADMLAAAGINDVTNGGVWAVTVGEELDMDVDLTAGSANAYNLTLGAVTADLGDNYYVLMKVTVGNDVSYIDITSPEAVEIANDTTSITVGLVFLVNYDLEMKTFPIADENGWGASDAPADAGEVLADADFIFRLTPQA